MTIDEAKLLLLDLDDLAVRVCVLEARRPGDSDIASLKRDVQERRERIIEYLAACRADRDADAMIH